MNPGPRDRAAAVVEYLVQHGVAESRLVSKGYGKSRPLVSGARSEEDHQKNRRVEFNIIEQDSNCAE